VSLGHASSPPPCGRAVWRFPDGTVARRRSSSAPSPFSAPSARTSCQQARPGPSKSTSFPSPTTNAETERLADLIEGVAGEFSPFEELHGFSIDGVDLSTSALPTGWRTRLVKVQNANTAAPDGEPQYTGWCLDKEDLCVAKLCAFREKDQNFVAALVRSALVDRKTILTRLSAADERYGPTAEVAASWLRSLYIGS
jgi:hypothetical protein